MLNIKLITLLKKNQSQALRFLEGVFVGAEPKSKVGFAPRRIVSSVQYPNAEQFNLTANFSIYQRAGAIITGILTLNTPINK